MKQIFLFILLVIVPFITIKSQDGEMVAITFQSSSIENNLIGESAEINVGVFLPPGYHEKLSKRYPVIYWLHGFSGWKNTSGKSGWDEERINSLIKKMISGEIKPMIIVMPDSSNKFGGSFYANSVTTGNWEDLIAFEVPGFIDKNYRTLPKPESRGIAGHSMGGSGAMRIAMKHSDVFSAIYAYNSCCLSNLGFLFNKKVIEETINIKTWEDRRKASFYAKGTLAISAAYSPNSEKALFYLDLPYKLMGDSIKINENVMAKWTANTPLWMIDQNISNLKKLRGIIISVGTMDPYKQGSEAFSLALNKLKIDHYFDVFKGGHGDKNNERILNNIVPYFSKTLAFE
ncbi:MAG: alpha/beta hydrolase [Flavobacteriaceae bacterium]